MFLSSPPLTPPTDATILNAPSSRTSSFLRPYSPGEWIGVVGRLEIVDEVFVIIGVKLIWREKENVVICDVLSNFVALNS